MIAGTVSSMGTGMGKVLVIKNKTLIIQTKEGRFVEEEKYLLLDALEMSMAEIVKIREKLIKELGVKKITRFKAQMMILEDPEIISNTIYRIEKEHMKAEDALKVTIDEFVKIFEVMDNELLRERVKEIRDISERIIRNIIKQKNSFLGIDNVNEN